VLLLIAATSISVLVFFARTRTGDNVSRRVIAPAAATIGLVVIVYLAVDNFATLLGVDTSSPPRRILPDAYIVAAAVGLVWALVLCAASPQVYLKIGLGARAAAVPESSLAPAAGER
jgi:hypothetical protein